MADRVVLAANKCERRGSKGVSGVEWALAEATSLGFGEVLAVSAETGEGMTELYQALQPLLDPVIEAREAVVAEVAGEEMVKPVKKEKFKGKMTAAMMTQRNSTAAVKVAIMGLVNVGKSTLTNWLVKEERCLTGPEPGLTRDAITVQVQHAGRAVELVDTAGWVRRAKLSSHDDVGGVVADRTLREGRTVLRFVHVVLLVVDAARALQLGEGLTHAESALAAAAAAEGRALIVVANKIDTLSELEARDALELVQSAVEQAAPGVRGGAVLAVSAVTGQGADFLLPAAIEAYEVWNRRVPTSHLNRWLDGVVSGLPRGGGSELKRVKYISQVKARPPTFVVFISGATDFNDASERFLANLIRKGFSLDGVPLRVTVRRRERVTRPKKRPKKFK